MGEEEDNNEICKIASNDSEKKDIYKENSEKNSENKGVNVSNSSKNISNCKFKISPSSANNPGPKESGRMERLKQLLGDDEL